MSESRAGRALWSQVGLGAAVVVVLVLVLVVRPGDSEEESPGSRATATPATVGPTGAPPRTRVFCDAFRRLAEAQAVYAGDPDGGGADLREAADSLVAMGPPDPMPIEARGGLYTLVSGIYGSLGETLRPQAVPGAADGPQIAGADQAFAVWLTDSCPA